jgi:anti-sigma-K factor RskA
VPHLEEDDLMLVAFGQQPEGDDAAAHLASCAHCQAEIQALTQLVTVGRQTRDVSDLPPPPPRVWARVAAQTQVDSVPQPPSRPIVNKAPWLRLALAGAAAALVAAVGTWLLVRPGPPTPPTVVASAQLSAFGNTPAQAKGSAQVLSGGRLAVDVTNLPPAGPGYYEVWLIDPDTSQMFSVGVLGNDPRATFPLPPNVDLTRYRLVDVSVEQFDNQPTHSGDSLLRGALT